MAILPPYDPNLKPGGPDLDPTGRAAPEPDVRYVTSEEAAPEDRLTYLDRMALMAGIGCAQFLRLMIIFAAFGILFLVIFLVSHL